MKIGGVYETRSDSNRHCPVRPASLPDARRSVDRYKEYRATSYGTKRQKVARNEVTEGRFRPKDACYAADALPPN